MNDSVKSFFVPPHGHPRFSSYPADQYMVGMEFEVGGAYEDWGWIMYEKYTIDGVKSYKTFCTARTLDKLMEKAEIELTKKEGRE